MVKDDLTGVDALRQEVKFLKHLSSYLYESLGPANDDIWQMAIDDYKAEGGVVPAGYSEEE